MADRTIDGLVLLEVLGVERLAHGARQAHAVLGLEVDDQILWFRQHLKEEIYEKKFFFVQKKKKAVTTKHYILFHMYGK